MYKEYNPVGLVSPSINRYIGQRFVATPESFVRATPVILKYPKYHNWEYIPRKITPEFDVWSYYELDENSINLTINTLRTSDGDVILPDIFEVLDFIDISLTDNLQGLTVYNDVVYLLDNSNDSVYSVNLDDGSIAVVGSVGIIRQWELAITSQS